MKLINDNKKNFIIIYELLSCHYFCISASQANGASRYSRSPDDDVFIYLSKIYSYAHRKMHLGQACGGGSGGFPDGITNGASWYPVRGTYQ